jgi:outer membrane protein assembly factor BamB
MGPNRDAVWAETGVDRFPDSGPKVLWRAPVARGYAGPAVAGGCVYVADYLSKDEIPKGAGGPADFNRSALTGVERVLCLDAATGKELWWHEYDCRYDLSYPGGPRCTPTVSGGKVYALGAMGHLFCLDAATGKVAWSKDFVKDYGVKAPLFGFCGHPLVEGKKLICTIGGEGTTAVAFDKDTGKELWRALSSRETGYSPPTLIEAGGKRQLLIWHGEGLNALDPETGEGYWSHRLSVWQGVTVMAPRKDGDHLFAGTVFGAAVCLKLDPAKPAAALAWGGPKNKPGVGLFPMNMTPFAAGGVLYGVDQTGVFRAVRTATGERLWESWRPVTGKDESGPVFNGTAFVVRNADRYFLFNERGELVIVRLSPERYEELSRARLIEPTGAYGGRKVVWSHPAFAGRCVFVRNDRELLCASLGN